MTSLHSENILGLGSMALTRDWGLGTGAPGRAYALQGNGLGAY